MLTYILLLLTFSLKSLEKALALVLRKCRWPSGTKVTTNYQPFKWNVYEDCILPSYGESTTILSSLILSGWVESSAWFPKLWLWFQMVTGTFEAPEPMLFLSSSNWCQTQTFDWSRKFWWKQDNTRTSATRECTWAWINCPTFLSDVYDSCSIVRSFEVNWQARKSRMQMMKTDKGGSRQVKEAGRHEGSR